MRLGGLAVICLLLLPATAQGAASPRVVGGKAVPEGGYPAIANVNIAGAFGCSGTLVAPDWVLTAGHCGSLTSELIATPIAFPAALITVTLGTVHTNGAGGTVRGVSEIRIPSGHFALSVDTGYDISLLHLSSPAPQQPMLVAGKGEEQLWAPGHMETVAGFGITSETGSPPPVMQEANVPIVDDAKCREANPDIFEPVTQICAGFPQGGVDTCNGDSGGPMFTQSPAGGLRIVGTTSYGQGCARPNQYGVYARVGDATLREWIRSIAPAAVAPDYVAPPPKPAPEPKPKKKKKHKKKKKKHKEPAKKHK